MNLLESCEISKFCKTRLKFATRKFAKTKFGFDIFHSLQLFCSKLALAFKPPKKTLVKQSVKPCKTACENKFGFKKL